MTSATFNFPKNRLNKLLKQSGGKSVAEAVRDASAAVEQLKPPCLETIDESLAVVDQRMKTFVAATDKAGPARQIYEAVNGVIGLAGAVGLAELDQAAYSLCDLLDQMARIGRWDVAAVAVHVQSIHLLRSPATLGSQASVRAILMGLKQVREKVLAPDTGEGAN
jgi:hypothetical protein